jgi:hypothetical protein
MSGSSLPLPFEVNLDEILKLPVEEREREFANAAVLKRVIEANPLWRYLPHEGELGGSVRRLEELRLAQGPDVAVPRHLVVTGQEQRGQVAFHEIDTPYGAFVAGNRSGKSHGGLADDAIQTLPLEICRRGCSPTSGWVTTGRFSSG